MKAYQIKVLLKNAKPPVWRRCRIPAGITFSQLALILEDITESEPSAEYEFEFYQAGIRVLEWKEETWRADSFYYDLFCASDTFVNKLLEEEAWFTFRPGDGRQYRVERERCLSEAIPFPEVVKQQGNPQICGWSEPEAVNRRLEQRCPIRYGTADHRTFEELRSEREEGRWGLTGTARPKSRTGRRKESVDSQMREVSDALRRQDTQVLAEKLRKASGVMSGETPDVDALRRLLEEEARKIRQGIQEEGFRRDESREESRNPEVQDFLMEETKETLREIAQGLKLPYGRTLRKEQLAEAIRDEILKPEVMERRMLLLSDAEIQAFETALAKERGFYPNPEELAHLEKLYDLTYVALYVDDYAEVPRAVAETYRTINTEAFQEKRRETYWLYHCLRLVPLFYGCVPVSVFCRLLKRCLGHSVTQSQLETLWENLPESLNPCVLQDGRVIYKEILQNRLYLEIEESQGGKTFYLPEPQEILEYTENGYPVSDPYYRKLKTFLVGALQVGLDKAEEYMPVIWDRFGMGYALSDIVDFLEAEGVKFTSAEQIRTFVQLMMEVNNHTRMVVNRGWTPNEMAAGRSPMPRGKLPTLIPMSSEAARLLGEVSEDLTKKGFQVDLEHGAEEVPTFSMPDGISGKTVVGKKKIYPNDPCPCGSGKKYKNCCGRKR